MKTHYFVRFIGQGEFGEVFQGTAYDILGPETGPHPVAIKVCLISTCSLHVLSVHVHVHVHVVSSSFHAGKYCIIYI